MTNRVCRTACVAMVLAVLGGGCKGKSDAAATTGSAPSTPSGATAPAAQGEPTAAVPPTGGSGGWMDGIPGTVPPFESGAFGADSRRNDVGGGTVMYSLYYEGVPLEYAKSYLDRLRAAGLSVQEDANGPDGVSAYGELKEGGAKRLGYTFAWQPGGHVDLTVTVNGNPQ
jgi:hypothetical protein